MAGYNALRWAEDHAWGGVSPDNTIEKTLMWSLKSTGGLKRGTWFEEIQCNIYILSWPACAEVSTSIENSQEQKTFLVISINRRLIQGFF